MGTLAIIGSIIGVGGVASEPAWQTILTEPFTYKGTDADPTPLEDHNHLGVVWEKDSTSVQMEIVAANNYLTPDVGSGLASQLYFSTLSDSVNRITVDVKNTGTPGKANIVNCYMGWKYVSASNVAGMIVRISDTNLTADTVMQLHEWTGATHVLRASVTASADGLLGTFKEIIITEEAGHTLVDATAIHASLTIDYAGIGSLGDVNTVCLPSEVTTVPPGLNDENIAWDNLVVESWSTTEKPAVTANLFFPCDDNTCQWWEIGAITGTITPSETFTAAPSGASGIVIGATASTAIMLRAVSGTPATGDTITTSGGSCVTTGSVFYGFHDLVAERGYSPDDLSYSGITPTQVDLGTPYAPFGTAPTAPGTKSCILTVVVSHTGTQNKIFSYGDYDNETHLRIWSDRGQFRDGDPAQPSSGVNTHGTVTPIQTPDPIKGEGIVVICIVVNRTSGYVEHWVDGVKIAENLISSGMADFNSVTKIETATAGLITNIYKHISVMSFTSVPTDIATWMTEVKTNADSASSKGDRRLPVRWTYT